ncbi:hypothetical protein P154DRAFT_524436 [Amniculicola lignicola CBS 123094]|uniref:Secreted protein n=1 Tax=Amniculicola lignicola CBS 123094 TaxID=1392246 RepID=A0A6A5WCL8_9PLEO|nr:hypothetical protein P154DRAFT_524436 [Amniculicola lignicola CBS 123094]
MHTIPRQTLICTCCCPISVLGLEFATRADTERVLKSEHNRIPRGCGGSENFSDCVLFNNDLQRSRAVRTASQTSRCSDERFLRVSEFGTSVRGRNAQAWLLSRFAP